MRVRQAERVAGLGSAIEVLRAREEEVAREWEWLHEAVNRVANTMARDDNIASTEVVPTAVAATDAFRLLQHQAMAVGQRRVELRLRLAALERAHGVGST